MCIKFQDKKYVKMKYFKDKNWGRRGLVTALHAKIDVVVIKNENALLLLLGFTTLLNILDHQRRFLH